MFLDNNFRVLDLPVRSPKEHIWAEVDRRRGPQRDNVHMETDGIDCLKLALNTGSMLCQWRADVKQLLKQKLGQPANNTLY